MSQFSDGPLALLRRIVAAQGKLSGEKPDARGLVTVHSHGARTWSGVPVELVAAREGEFVVLARDSKRTALATNQIVALEVDNPAQLESLFAHPWLQDVRFASMSKLEAMREIDTAASGLPRVNVYFDSFPKAPEAPGFAVVWVERLREAIAAAGGAEALGVDVVQVTHSAQGMSCAKVENTLRFTVELSEASINRHNIADCLSRCL